ncbi:unnamed protein product [Angiostrongylus costaricensis]|uniref:Transmembrane protein 144 n=1 Tax=Angiostrongylus costaricensis TaxID=334426 RepID=A0A158PGB6_ANGCS|nr:unnamed protein product [Angiostrongylus costaricensis]
MDGIGMAVGSLLWNTITCVVGWAVTRFGLLGNPQQSSAKYERYIGEHHHVVLGISFFHLLFHVRNVNLRGEKWKKYIAILLTVFVGCLYGNVLSPINYLVMHSAETGNPSNISSYFFSFCLGSVLTSTVIFMIYSLARFVSIKFNRPFMNPELTLPSLISGIIYAVATYCFFLANQHLDQTIAYPILAKAPGVIVSLWAVFLFKEIKGCRDLTALSVGILVTITGITLISVSKIQF